MDIHIFALATFMRWRGVASPFISLRETSQGPKVLPMKLIFGLKRYVENSAGATTQTVRFEIVAEVVKYIIPKYIMTLVEDILPRDLDIDANRFPCWRTGQYGIFMDTLECQTRVSGHCVSCGFGKTLIMAAHARATGKRTLILTPFKGLQDQMIREMDFIVDLRGKANYSCGLLSTNCEIGSPRCAIRKSVMSIGLCEHKTAQDRAAKADIVVMNYSCWFHQMNAQGVGKFDTIICDECDQADQQLSDHLAFTLTSKEVLGELHTSRAPHWNDPLTDWIGWGKDVIERLAKLLNEAEKDAKEIDDSYILERFFHLRSLHRKITTLTSMFGDDWITETVRDGIRFDPIWPGRFTESYLFRGIPRVLLFSGTLNEKTFGLLGIRKADRTFYEYPSPFHPYWNPLILTPVGEHKAFSHPIQSATLDAAVDLFDKIADARMDRKGILHTISFPHLNDIIERSRHANSFISNDTKYFGGNRKTTDVVETFKAASPPAILASPSITAGWDFPDDYCRWTFIFKVPFPDTTSLVAKARQKLDREYYNNKAMTSLIQMCSRPCRSEKDWNENIIPDPRVGWFLKANEHLAPKWFMGSSGVRRFRRMAEGILPTPMKGS